MNEYKIITVCNRRPTEPYYTFDEFFKSAGEQVWLLGTQPGEYGGLGSKPRLLYNAIKAGAIKEKYIIFSDCFDIVFAVPPIHLFLKYKQFCSPLVISAEKNCFPDTHKKEYDELIDHDYIETPYRYLNSGMIVGETDAMLAVLESMDAKNIPNDYWDEEKNCNVHPNDQEYYQKEFLKQPVQITLDRWQILCNTLHDVKEDEFDFSGNRILNKVTRTYPCSFHLNGGAKTGGLREPILQKLNLL
jgi:hypothetical protein